MCSRGGAFAQAEPPVGAFAAIVREYAGDIQRTGRLRIAQKPGPIGRRFGSVDADEHPAGGAVVRHEPVETPGFVLHLQQVFDLDVAIERCVGLDELVGGSRGFVHQIRQVSNLVTPQTPIQPRARDLRIEEFPQRAIAGAIGSSPTSSANRTPSDSKRLQRRTTFTASCAGVSGVCRRYRVCAQSGTVQRLRHFQTVRARHNGPPEPGRVPRAPGFQPGPAASSWPASEAKSAADQTLLNVPQDRSCHEKAGTTRHYVIIRDETGKSQKTSKAWRVARSLAGLTWN